MTSEAIMLASAVLFGVAVLINALSRYSGPEQKIAILEAKLNYLYRKTGITYEPFEGLSPDIRRALERGQKIVAIKLYREANHAGLKEAKDAIESIQRGEAPSQTRSRP